MILDDVFHGILDQGAGCLLIFDDPEEDVSYNSAYCSTQSLILPHADHSVQKTYDASLDVMKHVGQVIDSLYKKAEKLR